MLASIDVVDKIDYFIQKADPYGTGAFTLTNCVEAFNGEMIQVGDRYISMLEYLWHFSTNT